LGKEETVVKKWMDAETYFSAREALEAGIATEIIDNSVPVMKRKTTMPKRTRTEKFQTWLKKTHPEMLRAKLPVEQVKKLKREFSMAHKPKTNLKVRIATPAPSLDMTDIRRQMADETSRVGAINRFAQVLSKDVIQGGIHLSKDYLKSINLPENSSAEDLTAHAIREGWSADNFELHARRATIQNVGHLGIHVKESQFQLSEQAVSCALMRASNQPANGTHKMTGESYGYENQFDEKVLEESESKHLRDASLLSIMHLGYRKFHGRNYEGRLNTDGFISAYRDTLLQIKMASGTTQWSTLNIFDDAANKTLWNAYRSIATTWQSFVQVVSVSDFKTNNFYRMTNTGSYKLVPANGNLQHGGFTDSKFTTAANTYGKIVGLSRRDLINDDLGAFNSIMTALGTEGAKFLEELFWVRLMGQLGTIFPTNDANKNYISGTTTVLGVDGLTLGATKMSDQVDADNSPIANEPDILLVGTNNRVIADELYTKTNLRVVQSANVKGRPDDNPYVGKYRPVVSGYMNNTLIKQRIADGSAAVPGQSSTHWILVNSPTPNYGGIILGAFLNGKQSPTIEQADAAFEVLGMQWRAFSDAGASNGDPKLGVYSKGAA